MLEFLNNCNEILYERGKDCEHNLTGYNKVTFMAILLENIFKEIYAEHYPNANIREVNRKDFFDFFKINGFVEYIQQKYNITERQIVIADEIRRYSNIYKHDTEVDKISMETIKKYFRCVYFIAAKYCRIKTNKNVPDWDENEYENIINQQQEENDIRSQYGNLQKQLADTQDALQTLIENSVPKEKLEEYKNKNKELQQNIDEIGYKLILESQKQEASQKECERLEYKIAELKESATADSDVNKKKIKELELLYSSECDKNEIIRKEVEELRNQQKTALEDRDSLEEQLRIQSENSEHQDTIADLKKKLEDVGNKLHEKEELIIEMQNRTIAARENIIFKTGQQYQDAETEKIKMAQITPKCPHCGATLKPKPSNYSDGYYWACPNWKKNGSGCIGFTRNVNYDEEYIVKYIIGLQKNEQATKYNIPREVLEQAQPVTAEFDDYPYYFRYVSSTESFFQSLAIPSELFEKREQLNLNRYSRFKFESNLNKIEVDDEKCLIYSLALRVLNRGIMVPTFARTEEKLRKKFNQKSIGNTESLFNYISYDSPRNPYSSEREKEFAEKYFPKLLGQAWATYVYAQAPISALISECGTYFAKQKIDFLVITGKGKKSVIELDGEEHKKSAEYDNERDLYLEKNGYSVLRISNRDFDFSDPKIGNKLEGLIAPEEWFTVELDDKYIVACKLSHQLAIAIVKGLEQGYIRDHANLSVDISSSMFTKEEIEFILNTAISEVYDLVQNFAIIYNKTIDLDLRDEDYDNTTIFVGDGYREDEMGIMIRDMYIPQNFLCELEEFAWKGEILSPDKIALSYMLKYIFGPEYSFREGQYEAISRLLQKKDSIILLPTGAGKSLIYQLSSYIVPGIIFVISPLISLMEDQIFNLEKRFGITGAISFSSSKSRNSRKETERNKMLMHRISTSLIYCSPERLHIPSFRKDVKLILAHNNIFAAAIDEAHCVSEWGHDFRTAYLNLGNVVRKIFRKNDIDVPLIALTGTASDAVLNDIRRDLRIEGEDALVQPRDFNRNELHFRIKTCLAYEKSNYVNNIICKDLPKAFEISYERFALLADEETYSGIIYTPYARGKSEYSAIHLSGKLSESLPGINTAYYFSKVPKEIDEMTWDAIIKENARAFKDNDINILVATNAFGMGIDKRNVRFIVHNGLAPSFEQYYQEVGRAGRDGNDSECVLLFSNDNAEENEKLLDASLTTEQFKQLYNNSNQKDEYSLDDLSALLRFHSNSFAGIDEDYQDICEIIDLFEQNNASNGTNLYYFIQVKTENSDGGKNVHRGDKEKMLLKATIRLIILGVIRDYSYDYKGNLNITVGNLDYNSVIESFSRYLAVDNKDVLTYYVGRLKLLNSNGIEFIKDAARVLIEYIYENIEQSRRRAISEMYYMAKEASTKVGEEQDKFIREKIVQYFTYSGVNRDEIIAVSTGENAGLDEVVALLKLEASKIEFSEEEIESANSTYVLAGRRLESKPDHPGLLMTQAAAKIIATGQLDNNIISNTIASVRYAYTRYSVPVEKILPPFFSTLNLIMDKDVYVFDRIIDETCSYCEMSKKDMISKAIKSGLINEKQSEYLLLSYADELVKNIKTGEDK